MTITELKNALIATGVYAEIDDVDEVINVYENEFNKQEGDWFISIPFDALLFFHLNFDQGAADNLDLATVAAVETSISLFLMTPEEARGISEVLDTSNNTSSPCQGFLLPVAINNSLLRKMVFTSLVGVMRTCTRYLPRVS